jgi:hypothetical protein
VWLKRARVARRLALPVASMTAARQASQAGSQVLRARALGAVAGRVRVLAGYGVSVVVVPTLCDNVGMGRNGCL